MSPRILYVAGRSRYEVGSLSLRQGFELLGGDACIDVARLQYLAFGHQRLGRYDGVRGNDGIIQDSSVHPNEHFILYGAAM